MTDNYDESSDSVFFDVTGKFESSERGKDVDGGKKRINDDKLNKNKKGKSISSLNENDSDYDEDREKSDRRRTSRRNRSSVKSFSPTRSTKKTKSKINTLSFEKPKIIEMPKGTSDASSSNDVCSIDLSSYSDDPVLPASSCPPQIQAEPASTKRTTKAVTKTIPIQSKSSQPVVQTSPNVIHKFFVIPKSDDFKNRSSLKKVNYNAIYGVPVGITLPSSFDGRPILGFCDQKIEYGKSKICVELKGGFREWVSLDIAKHLDRQMLLEYLLGKYDDMCC